MTYVLWTIQILLALLFAVAGGTKLALPLDVLQAQMQVPLPGALLRFIGAAELLGALGLVLPGLLRIRPELTPLAAAGLATLMLGALLCLPDGADLTLALLPGTVGVLAAVVACGRWRRSPARAGRQSVLQPAS